MITKEQIEFFLGGDNLENSCLTELEFLANGTYSPEQFKKDVLSHWNGQKEWKKEDKW